MNTNVRVKGISILRYSDFERAFLISVTSIPVNHILENVINLVFK